MRSWDLARAVKTDVIPALQLNDTSSGSKSASLGKCEWWKKSKSFFNFWSKNSDRSFNEISISVWKREMIKLSVTCGSKWDTNFTHDKEVMRKKKRIVILLHISSLLQAIRSTGDSSPHEAVYFSVIDLFLNTCDWYVLLECLGRAD